MAVRPIIIRDEDSLVALLRGRREALGISQQDLDSRIGWPDFYCAKAESPGRKYGRRVAWGLSHFLAYWLEALGLTLVVMDKRQAETLIAASEGVDLAAAAHNPYPGRTRRREVVQRLVLRGGVSFPGGRRIA